MKRTSKDDLRGWYRGNGEVHAVRSEATSTGRTPRCASSPGSAVTCAPPFGFRRARGVHHGLARFESVRGSSDAAESPNVLNPSILPDAIFGRRDAGLVARGLHHAGPSTDDDLPSAWKDVATSARDGSASGQV